MQLIAKTYSKRDVTDEQKVHLQKRLKIIYFCVGNVGAMDLFVEI